MRKYGKVVAEVGVTRFSSTWGVRSPSPAGVLASPMLDELVRVLARRVRFVGLFEDERFGQALVRVSPGANTGDSAASESAVIVRGGLGSLRGTGLSVSSHLRGAGGTVGDGSGESWTTGNPKAEVVLARPGAGPSVSSNLRTVVLSLGTNLSRDSDISTDAGDGPSVSSHLRTCAGSAVTGPSASCHPLGEVAALSVSAALKLPPVPMLMLNGELVRFSSVEVGREDARGTITGGLNREELAPEAGFGGLSWSDEPRIKPSPTTTASSSLGASDPAALAGIDPVPIERRERAANEPESGRPAMEPESERGLSAAMSSHSRWLPVEDETEL